MLHKRKGAGDSSSNTCWNEVSVQTPTENDASELTVFKEILKNDMCVCVRVSACSRNHLITAMQGAAGVVEVK